MKRRRFLGAMLGGMAAPAIVKAEHLMKIVVPKQEIILPVKLHHQNGISGAFLRDVDIAETYPKTVVAHNVGDMDVMSEYTSSVLAHQDYLIAEIRRRYPQSRQHFDLIERNVRLFLSV